MEINRIVWNSSVGVVLAEDEVGSLLVILVHLSAMGFAFFRQVVCGSSISPLVGLTRLYPRSALGCKSAAQHNILGQSKIPASQLLVAQGPADDRILAQRPDSASG